MPLFFAAWLGASLFLIAAMKLQFIHFGWLRLAAFPALASTVCVLVMIYICCARFAERNNRADLLAVVGLIGSPLATGGLMYLTGAEIGRSRHVPIHYSDIVLMAAAFFDVIPTVAVGVAILCAMVIWNALDHVVRRRMLSSPLV